MSTGSRSRSSSPTLQGLYHWSESGYGGIVFWFQAAYGIGYLLFGRLDRPDRRQGRLCAGDAGVDRGAHGACLVHLGARLLGDQDHPRHRRIRHLSGRARRRRRMVSQARARLRHRPVQRRRQCRRDRDALAGAGDRARAELAGGLHRHRPHQHRLDRGLDPVLPQAAPSIPRSARPSSPGSNRSRSRSRSRSRGGGSSPPARPGPIWPAAS